MKPYRFANGTRRTRLTYGEKIALLKNRVSMEYILSGEQNTRLLEGTHNGYPEKGWGSVSIKQEVRETQDMSATSAYTSFKGDLAELKPTQYQHLTGQLKICPVSKGCCFSKSTMSSGNQGCPHCHPIQEMVTSNPGVLRFASRYIPPQPIATTDFIKEEQQIEVLKKNLHSCTDMGIGDIRETSSNKTFLTRDKPGSRNLSVDTTTPTPGGAQAGLPIDQSQIGEVAEISNKGAAEVTKRHANTQVSIGSSCCPRACFPTKREHQLHQAHDPQPPDTPSYEDDLISHGFYPGNARPWLIPESVTIAGDKESTEHQILSKANSLQDLASCMNSQLLPEEPEITSSTTNPYKQINYVKYTENMNRNNVSVRDSSGTEQTANNEVKGKGKKKFDMYIFLPTKFFYSGDIPST